MDIAFIGAWLWSPLWFFWDLANNFIILYSTRKWVNAGVHDTTDQVITKLCEPKTFKKVRKAMKIPTTSMMRKIIREEITGLLVPVTTDPIESGKEGALLKKEHAQCVEDLDTALMASKAIDLKAVLIKKGVPEMVAGIAAEGGPKAVRGALVEFLGMSPKAAKAFVNKLILEAAAHKGEVTSSAGGW